jgi:hypothetical protein
MVRATRWIAMSLSRRLWIEASAVALDRMESAHRAVGGTSKGHRHAMQQINQSYLMLLSSHFQRFCRDLHAEAADHLAGSIDPRFGEVVRAALTLGRKLDQGNPNPGNLGSDFGRLGMRFWPELTSAQKRNGPRKDKLSKMTHWRNSIAHQDGKP